MNEDLKTHIELTKKKAKIFRDRIYDNESLIAELEEGIEYNKQRLAEYESQVKVLEERALTS